MSKRKNSKRLRKRGVVCLLQKIRNECEDINTNLNTISEQMKPGANPYYPVEPTPIPHERTAPYTEDVAAWFRDHPESLQQQVDANLESLHDVATIAEQAKRIKELEERVAILDVGAPAR